MTPATIETRLEKLATEPPESAQVAAEELTSISADETIAPEQAFQVAQLWKRFAGLEHAEQRCEQQATAALGQGYLPAALTLSAIHLARSDSAAAMHSLRVAAESGWSEALLTLAYLLDVGAGGTADPAQASNLYLRAAAQGDTTAFLVLTHRYLDGRGVPRDATIAALWVMLAELRNYPGSKRAKLKLEQSLNRAEWRQASQLAGQYREHLQSLAERASTALSPDALQAEIESHHNAFGLPEISMDHSTRGDGKAVGHSRRSLESVSASPRVFRAQDFLSSEEVALTLRHAGQMPQPVDGNEQPQQTPLGEDPVAVWIVEQVGQVLCLPPGFREDPWLLAYAQGASYPSHFDYSDARTQAERMRGYEDRRGQRLGTASLCLQSARAGGDLHFDALSESITQQPRDLALHFNTLPSGALDLASAHHTTRVESGHRRALRCSFTEHHTFHSGTTL